MKEPTRTKAQAYASVKYFPIRVTAVPPAGGPCEGLMEVMIGVGLAAGQDDCRWRGARHGLEHARQVGRRTFALGDAEEMVDLAHDRRIRARRAFVVQRGRARHAISVCRAVFLGWTPMCLGTSHVAAVEAEAYGVDLVSWAQILWSAFAWAAAATAAAQKFGPVTPRVEVAVFGWPSVSGTMPCRWPACPYVQLVSRHRYRVCQVRTRAGIRIAVNGCDQAESSCAEPRRDLPRGLPLH